MSRVDKHFLLEKENVEYIKTLKNEKYPTESLAINYIIKEHRKRESNDTQIIVNMIVEQSFEKINNELKKYNTKLNSTDKNIQIMLELFNGILVANNLNDIAMTDELESNSLSKAKETITKRIEKKRYHKSKELY